MQFGPIGSLIPPFIREQFAQNRRAGHMRAVVLFVDISGFTPLTESLMGRLKDGSDPKGGAEALSDVVMAIFDPMVSQVASCSGIIPLFAGDAFAAIFPQADNQTGLSVAQMAAARALLVVDFIQHYFSDPANGLRGVRTFQTPYGDFAIGVKVGLAFGDVAWGIRGKTAVTPITFAVRPSPRPCARRRWPPLAMPSPTPPCCPCSKARRKSGRLAKPTMCP